jgi:nitrogen fixation/metabolism regulation signal transduction histidine kinase
MEEISFWEKKYRQSQFLNLNILNIKELQVLKNNITITGIDLFALKEGNKDDKQTIIKNKELYFYVSELNKLIDKAVIKKNVFLEGIGLQIKQQLQLVLWITIISIMFTLVAAIILSLLFSHFISKPIILLCKFTKNINKNPDERVHLKSNDEIGGLSESMNMMLDDIKKNNETLNIISRKAGMAEVSTVVLHNIGNVLNSVGVSITMLNETLNKSTFNNISRLCALLKEHHTNLQEYLTQDTKGKLLPEYFIHLCSELEILNNTMKNESQSLLFHFNHIGEIVNMQSAISGNRSTVVQKMSISEIVDIVTQMVAHELETKNIKLDKPVDNFFVTTDKSRLLQIIVNLIQNSKDSLMELKVDKLKIISIKANENKSENFFEIIIEDNGIGISKETLSKLFTFGFTTKKSGHGFGLHNSILSAKELGGSIMVRSEGIDLGATFILRLPIS